MRGQLCRVWCSFEPDHINPLTGRRGQWRVESCSSFGALFSDGAVLHYGDVIGLISTKRYRPGSIIRPHKELNRVLVAMRKPKIREINYGRSTLVRPAYYDAGYTEYQGAA